MVMTLLAILIKYLVSSAIVITMQIYDKFLNSSLSIYLFNHTYLHLYT